MFNNKKRIKVNGTVFPLICNSVRLFRHEFIVLEKEVKSWVICEKKIIPEETKIVETILHNLATFNFNSLSTSTGKQQLEKLFSSDTNQQLVDRLNSFQLMMDITIDPQAIAVCKGRFYKSLLDQQVLTKKDITWMEVTYPVLWIMPLIQKTYQTVSFL